jgi:hypothetical protein
VWAEDVHRTQMGNLEAITLNGSPRRCPKSYDVLRINDSMTSCGLLSSHDDYSVVDLLPEEAAIITQLRDPVDRVISAYEFAAEVRSAAARQLREGHSVSL